MHSTTSSESTALPTDCTPTVYLIDDQQQERKTIAEIATNQGWDYASFSNADQFFALPNLSHPACLILNYRLEGENGFEVLQKNNSKVDAPPTLIVTGCADVPIATEFMRSGAMMLLLKPYSSDQLIDHVQQAFQHDSASLELRLRMAKLQACNEQLSDRQHRVVDLVLEGHLNKRIATLIGVSQRTIENERAEILDIFQVRNAVELATRVTEYRGFIAAKRFRTPSDIAQSN